MTAANPKAVLAALWRAAGQSDDALDAVTLTGAEPVLPSSFAVGTAAQVTIAASALAAAELWRLRANVARLIPRSGTGSCGLPYPVAAS